MSPFLAKVGPCRAPQRSGITPESFAGNDSVLSKWLRSFSDHINIVFGLSRIGGEILFPELTSGGAELRQKYVA
jgi:hypothetical protein